MATVFSTVIEKRSGVNLYGPKQLIDSIRSVRKNTIQIAEDIPEEHYGYPSPFPATAPVIDVWATRQKVGSFDERTWTQSTGQLRLSSTALHALCENTTAVVDEWNGLAQIVGAD
jgi:hypothetical protein